MQVVASQITKVHKSKKKLALIAACLVLLGLAYYLFVYRPSHSLSPKSKAVAEGKADYDHIFYQNLKKKDYEQYQSQLLNYEQSYVQLKDYKSAARILAEIQHNVPESKWSQEALQRMSELAKLQNNKEDYEKYTKALIALSQKLGDKSYAEFYTKQLNESESK